MPLYEYQCQECGLRFERRQGFSEAPVSECPECNGQVQRLIQPVGIIFKGSGFYVTDNRAKSSTRIPTKEDKDKKDQKDSKEAGSSTSTEASTTETSTTTKSEKTTTTTKSENK